MLEFSLELPPGYVMERDPDVFVLRREDGSMVGAFSTRGAVLEDVRRVVEEADSSELPPVSRKEDAERLYLRAYFFGHFEMFCGDESVPLGRNGKTLTILKYLLAQGARPVSQDHLMGWLWPDSTLKKARWSLNSAVHGLRKLLAGCPSAPSGVSYILLEEGYYRLGPDVRVVTDVEEFDEHYERGRRLEAAGRIEEANEVYEKAVRLYRGDYLVKDLYEDWTMVERERLANAYVDMLDRLAANYLEAGRFRESKGACYRALEKDRCHEDSHRLLMACYARMGQRDRAIRQYRLCERALCREYGASPSPETRSVYQGLLEVESL